MNLTDIIEPWGGRIAVRVETKKEFTPSGLYIPIDTAASIHAQRPTQGEIVAMGGYDDDPETPLSDDDDDLHLGDYVLFNKHAGYKISYQPKATDDQPRPDKEEIILLSEKDVLARIKLSTDGDLTVRS